MKVSMGASFKHPEPFDGGLVFRCFAACYKCQRKTDMDTREMCQQGWDAPVHIWQPDDGSWLQTQLCPRHAKWWTLRYWTRRFSWRIGKLSGYFSPGYGACFRCHTNWDYAHYHITDVPQSGGCFALCEPCWTDLTPKERLPFYRQLFDRWVLDGCNDRDWNEYREAILSEGQCVDEWPDVVG